MFKRLNTTSLQSAMNEAIQCKDVDMPSYDSYHVVKVISVLLGGFNFQLK